MKLKIFPLKSKNLNQIYANESDPIIKIQANNHIYESQNLIEISSHVVKNNKFKILTKQKTINKSSIFNVIKKNHLVLSKQRGSISKLSNNTQASLKSLLKITNIKFKLNEKNKNYNRKCHCISDLDENLNDISWSVLGKRSNDKFEGKYLLW
jgi:hypothetical protein